MTEITDAINAGNRPNLHSDWTNRNDQSLERRVSLSDFDEAMQLANLCAVVAAKLNHHPDLKIGWGYCHIALTTHSRKCITELDYQFAVIFDQLFAAINFENCSHT